MNNAQRRRLAKDARKSTAPQAVKTEAPHLATEEGVSFPQVAQQCRQTIHHALTPTPTAETVVIAGMTLMELTSKVLDAIPTPAKACRAGCFFCCYTSPPVASPLEVLTLAAYLKAHLSPDALTHLIARLTERESPVLALDNEELIRSKRACVLLKEGRCSVYDTRPLVCRAWHSFDRQSCETGFTGDPTTGAVSVDMRAMIVPEITQLAAEAALRPRPVDMAKYDMQSALLRALVAEQPVEDWLAGDDVFKGCRKGITMPGDTEESITAQKRALGAALGL